MKTTNILMFIAVITVVFAAISLAVTINKIGDFKALTGFATDTGTANLTIESLASINFTTDNIDWGSGMVDTEETLAYLDTKDNSVTNGNWTATGTGLILENIGNVNVSIDIKAGKTAATFLGGTSPDYEWRFEDSLEAGSCLNSTGGTDALPLDTFYDVNTTSPGTRVCEIFQFVDGTDSIKIHLNLSVPYNAITGARGDIITATATAI